jgi:hypothetical protein
MTIQTTEPSLQTHRPEAGAFAQLNNFIDGQFVPPRGNTWIDDIEPATGQVIAAIPDSDERDVDDAVAARRPRSDRDCCSVSLTSSSGTSMIWHSSNRATTARRLRWRRDWTSRAL